MEDKRIKKLYFSALHTQDFEEHPLKLLITDVFSFSKDEISEICEDVYTSLVYLLASCNKTNKIMELTEARRDLNFTKNRRNAVRFLLVSTDFIYELEKLENKNLDFLSGVSKDFFHSLNRVKSSE